jgi:hypothetical protein
LRQYRILLITGLGKPWDDGWYYKAGFEKNGHVIIPFDPGSTEDAGRKVFEIVKDSKPDFVLHTKDEFPPDVFFELKKQVKVIQWYPDPVIPEWFPPYVEASDVFFTMSEGLVDEFCKLNPNSHWLTQAFEPSCFQLGEITPADERKFSSEVTFVGNLGSKSQYLPRRQYLQAVINNGFKLKWWGPRLPRKLSTIPLIMGKLGRAYGGSFVWGENHARISQLSKIYLGFDSMPHIRKSMSERLYIAVGCGAFYMCQHVEGIEDILEPGKEIVTFHTEDEMIDMIRYYLENDDQRQKIARAGRQRVLKDHTYEIRIRQMMQVVESCI